MEGTVVTLGLHIDGRIAGQNPVLHRLLDALLNRRDVLPGNRAADDGILKLVPAAALHRGKLHPAVSELPPSARLLLVPPMLLDGALDRLLVRDLDFLCN